MSDEGQERRKREQHIEERYAAGIHFKQLGEHREGCFMCCHSDGLDPETFIVEDGFEYRDRLGRRGGRHYWTRFRCNDPDCEAVMLVRWDALARFVTAASPPEPRR